MSNQFSKWLVIGVLAANILPSAYAAAGSEGHGGTGIWLNNHLCLMDLVDNTGCQSAIIDTSLEPRPDYLAKVGSALESVFPRDSPQTRMISQKLTEIAKISPAAAESLIMGIRLYSWSMPPGELKFIGDDKSPLKLNEGDKVQLAIRQDRSIKFSGDLVPLLPLQHQVALVFHEIGYAFTRPEESVESGKYYVFQDSTHAKDFTGFIFGRILKEIDASQFDSLASYWLGLPTWKIKTVRYVSDSVIQSGPLLQFVTSNPYGVDWHAIYDPQSGFACEGKDCKATSIADWCAATTAKFGNGGIYFVSQQISVHFSPVLSGDSYKIVYIRADETTAEGRDAGGLPGSPFEASNCVSRINDSILNAKDGFGMYSAY